MRLRTVWIGLAAGVALIAVAIVVFVATFDANRYKPTIVALAEQHTGRRLSIDGDLSLSVWPKIALSMDEATLSGPNGKGTLARIDSAKIGVTLRPLLSRRLQVEHITLDGLNVDGVRHKDGSTNFDDLLARLNQSGTPPADTKPPASPADAASAAVAGILIADVKLRNAAFAWHDEGSGADWTLQPFDLEAERIGSGEPGTIRASGRLTAKQTGIDARFDASSDYRADFATGHIELTDLRTNFDASGGALPARGVKVSLDGQGVIELQRDTASFTLRGKVDGSPLQMQLTMPQLVPLSLQFDLTADQIFDGTLAGNGSLAAGGRIALNMNLQDIDIARAMRELEQREILEGRGSFAIDITGAGKTVPALERSLAGDARIALRDGALLGIDLHEVLHKLEATITTVRGGGSGRTLEGRAGDGDGGKTAFSSLEASFVIRQGIAHNEDLDLRSPLLRVGGNGDVDIPARSIDYRLHVSLVGTLAGQGGEARSSLRGVTIPIRVSGPIASLSYRIEVEQLARDALKREMTRQLEGRLLGKDKPDTISPQETKKPGPRDLLRGLIGR